jgi:hypothetical protein
MSTYEVSQVLEPAVQEFTGGNEAATLDLIWTSCSSKRDFRIGTAVVNNKRRVARRSNFHRQL